MKKNEKKSLPKFKAVTLGAEELGKARGGLYSEDASLDCTCGSRSVCSIDGTDEGD